MASLTQWTWIWVNSRSWWWTGRPGVLQSVGSQRVRHDWATELNWTEVEFRKSQYSCRWLVKLHLYYCRIIHKPWGQARVDPQSRSVKHGNCPLFPGGRNFFIYKINSTGRALPSSFAQFWHPLAQLSPYSPWSQACIMFHPRSSLKSWTCASQWCLQLHAESRAAASTPGVPRQGPPCRAPHQGSPSASLRAPEIGSDYNRFQVVIWENWTQ